MVVTSAAAAAPRSVDGHLAWTAMGIPPGPCPEISPPLSPEEKTMNQPGDRGPEMRLRPMVHVEDMAACAPPEWRLPVPPAMKDSADSSSSPAPRGSSLKIDAFEPEL
jgi:hypothetical protein